VSLPGANTRLSIVTGTAALFAGVAWIAKDIGGRVSPDPDYWDCNSSYDYVLNGVDTVAFLALGLTVLGLAELYRSEIGGRKALIGSLAAAGFAAAGLANLFEHCAGLEALGFVYVVGLLGMLLLVAFVLALRSAAIASWVVWLLLFGTGAALLFANQDGFVAFGGAWFVFGVVLLRKSSSESSARTRR
jgi:hypothetical protein